MKTSAPWQAASKPGRLPDLSSTRVYTPAYFDHVHALELCSLKTKCHTPLTETLVREYGLQSGAEELTRQMNRVFDALIHEVDQYGRSVIGFGGDAITCRFDGDDAWRATTCALAMQRAMTQLSAPPNAAIRMTLPHDAGLCWKRTAAATWAKNFRAWRRTSSGAKWRNKSLTRCWKSFAGSRLWIRWQSSSSSATAES
jgi:hypothetical protein